MGSCFSPSLANLYMGWWEECRLYAANFPHRESLVWYGHYIDDLLLVWQAGTGELREFHDHINKNDENLVFTMDYNTDKINFLDVTLFSEEGKIHTSLYRKPTLGNGILRAESCHPKHVVKNLPIGEYVRAKRSCSRPEDFVRETRVIDQRLKQRGYETGLLNRAQKIVSHKTRHKYLYDVKEQHCDDSGRPPTFVTTYSTKFNQVTDIVKRYLPILYQDPVLDNILNRGVQCVARKARSIGSILSPSALPTPTETNMWLRFKGFHKCGHNRCGICKFATQTKTFCSMSTSNTFPIGSFINCGSDHVIYLVTCTACSLSDTVEPELMSTFWGLKPVQIV